MVSGTLYTPKCYHKSQRIEIAAKFSKVQIKIQDYCPTESKDKPKFAKNCPSNVAPLFESNDKTVLFDTNAIAYFVGNKQIRGGNNEHYVTQWVNFADQVLMPSVANWLYPILGVINQNHQASIKAQENLKTSIKFLNDFLSTRTYFVNESITQADITLYTVLNLLFTNLLKEEYRNCYPHLLRWFITVANQPEVMEVNGPLNLCQQPLQYEPKPNEKASKKQSNKSQPKQDKPKVAPPEDIQENKDSQKVSKNILESLPTGTFNLDAFKRSFSNEDILACAIPHFWKNFDPANYSIWSCEYNYPEELNLLFMSTNLINGMFQRLQKIIKYAFSVMILFGEDKNSTISGIWVWRGTELIFDLSEDLQVDYESFTWKKLNPECSKDKQMIEDYFCKKITIDGRKVAKTLVFK